MSGGGPCVSGMAWFACLDPPSHTRRTCSESAARCFPAGGAGRALPPSGAGSAIQLTVGSHLESRDLKQCSSSRAVLWQPAHTCNTPVSNNNPHSNTSMGVLVGPARARMEPTVKPAGVPRLGVRFHDSSAALVTPTCVGVRP